MPLPCDLCSAAADTGSGGPLGQALGRGQPRVLARSPHAAAVPTIGAFVRGYLLIVPTRHTTSIGLLPRHERRAVADFTDRMAATLAEVYRGPLLGFEYGLNVPGARRIEHGHLHLLPSAVGAQLRRYLRFRLPLIEVDSLEHLPEDHARSYISVLEPGRKVSVYPVANDASPRLRLREIVAELDPRVPAGAWDWQHHPCVELMRATVDDLTGATAPFTTTGGTAR
jgi:diadenosine tetraphosphate (Ap4A) HIT family hydrolase